MSPTPTAPVLSLQDLVQLSHDRDAHIEEIKNEIAQEIDNLNNPKPLFTELPEEDK